LLNIGIYSVRIKIKYERGGYIYRTLWNITMTW
jgi:hypothetical protein